MGFFDENPEVVGSTGSYIGEDEKNAIAGDGMPFSVIAVVREADPFNPGGERHVLTVLLPDDPEEERLMAFNIGRVESRNRMLDAMVTWLSDPSNEPPVVKLEKVGKSWVLRPADAS